MRAFIIRPFGTKKGIDFDAVEKALIDPALARFNVSGRTTMDILRQGNIRLDMFQRLLTADLVIADVSIHNANVFYELGIRHALRDKRTFLIRCERDDVAPDEVPFDLKTDRYLSYQKNDPAACVPDLIEALRQTLNSEAQDSPVFMLLPDLEAQDRSRFLPIPLDFREEVERAALARESGDLGLLAEEAKGFEWEIEGLRVVGRAQFDLKAFEGARATWEAVRQLDPADIEANTWLGTTYERLRDLTRSDQALKRALDAIHERSSDASRSARALASAWGRDRLQGAELAEIHSLLGRNAKARWRQDWVNAPEATRREAALNSGYLDESFDAYERAFHEDLNHFYSGLNALAMLTIVIELAKALPDAWAARFDDEDEPERELDRRQEKKEKLAEAVDVSLDAARQRLKRDGKTDLWAEISVADLCLLTAKRPPRVATAYRKALAGVPDFAVDSARSQMTLYRQLGILTDNVTSGLSVIPAAPPDDQAPKQDAPQRVLLFTGHMIDAPDRQTPRFPRDKVDTARAAIKDAVSSEMKKRGGIAYGIAGCASGGDILFHQVCEELEIPTRIFLALPRDLFVKNSVAHAGPEWIEEFDRLCRSHPVRMLGESKELPRWLQDKPDYSIWQRDNLWMLFNALAAAGSANLTLIALWNGEAGDGPGGTTGMVARANDRGAKTIILNTKKIFTLA